MLTEDAERAAAIAAGARPGQLRAPRHRARGGRRRRAGPRASCPPEQAEAPALVLAGEGWHPGVVGIAASRLAERHWRPDRPDRARRRSRPRLGPQHPRLRPDRRARRVLGAPGPPRRPPRRRRARARARPARRVPRGLPRARRRAEISEADLVRTESVDALVGVGRERDRDGAGRAARAPRPVRQGQPRPAPDRPLRPAAHRPAARGGGAPLALRARERRRAGARGSPSA